MRTRRQEDVAFARRYLAVAIPVVASAAVAPGPAAWAAMWGAIAVAWAAVWWARERALDREAASTPVPAVRPLPAPVLEMAERSSAA